MVLALLPKHKACIQPIVLTAGPWPLVQNAVLG